MVEVEQRARSIFLQALEVDADKRSAFLAKVCNDDKALREKVDRLFLSKAELGEIKNFRFDSTNQELIANFQLIERIGEGGFGEIFSANQTFPFKRQVALKLLKRGMDSERVIARFETERQVLAMMDHPNVAKIYDAGITESGRPYFAMELVSGVSITEFCDAHKFSVRQRAELFLSVCSAIQHAHQKGIIHRDLKPTNILVSSNPEGPMVKVIDFGIAKAIGEHNAAQVAHTEHHEFLGTPSYMSPEQILRENNDVDTRSDVYTLGVVLYELLTGSTPFDSKRIRELELDEARRMIRELEPSRPSSKISTLTEVNLVASWRSTNTVDLTSQLRGELDWIVLKTLEKDRNRRYETVNALAQDLQRYLDDEPVSACPPSTLYQLGKFSRRHFQSLVSVAVAAAAAVGIIAILVWSSIEKIRTQAEAERVALELQAAQNDVRAKNFLDAIAQLNLADEDLRKFGGGKKHRVLEERLPKAVEIRKTVEDPELEAQIDYGIRSVWLKAQACFDIDVPPLSMIGQLPPFRANAYAQHPNGNSVVVGGHSQPFLIRRDVADQQIPAAEKTSKSKVWYSPTGKWIALATVDGELTVWDENASTCEGRWKPTEIREVLDLVFSDQENSLKLVDDSGTLHQLTIPSLAEIATPAIVDPGLTNKLLNAALSRDGDQLALVDSEGKLTVRNQESVLAKLSLPKSGACNLTWSWDSTWIAVNTTDRVIVLPIDGSLPTELLHATRFEPDRAVLTRDGRFLFTTGLMWDHASGQAILSTVHYPIGVSADGKTIACVGTDGITFASLTEPTVAYACYGHQSPVVLCAWSENCQRFASLDNSFVLCVWEADRGKLLYRVQLPPGDFYPDNGGLAMNGDGTIACYMYRQADLASCAYIVDISNSNLSQPIPLPVSGFFRAAFRESKNDFLGVCEDLQSDNRVTTTTLSVSMDGTVAAGQVIRRSIDGERRFLDHKLSFDGRYYAWLGPRKPTDPRRLEILETSADSHPTILNKSLARQAMDFTEPSMRLSPDFSRCWIGLGEKRAEHLEVFKGTTKSYAFERVPLTTDGRRWEICAPDISPQSMQRPVTLNLFRLDEKDPWIGFYRAGERGEQNNGTAFFSPDGNWATWGKDVGGQLTVVNLKALEEGVNAFLK